MKYPTHQTDNIVQDLPQHSYCIWPIICSICIYLLVAAICIKIDIFMIIFTTKTYDVTMSIPVDLDEILHNAISYLDLHCNCPVQA